MISLVGMFRSRRHTSTRSKQFSLATGIGIIRLSFNTTPDGTVFDSTFVAWITAYTIMTFWSVSLNPAAT